MTALPQETAPAAEPADEKAPPRGWTIRYTFDLPVPGWPDRPVPSSLLTYLTGNAAADITHVGVTKDRRRLLVDVHVPAEQAITSQPAIIRGVCRAYQWLGGLYAGQFFHRGTEIRITLKGR